MGLKVYTSKTKNIQAQTRNANTYTAIQSQQYNNTIITTEPQQYNHTQIQTTNMYKRITQYRNTQYTKYADHTDIYRLPKLFKIRQTYKTWKRKENTQDIHTCTNYTHLFQTHAMQTHTRFTNIYKTKKYTRCIKQKIHKMKKPI